MLGEVRGFDFLDDIAARIVIVAGDDVDERRRPADQYADLRRALALQQAAMVVSVSGRTTELIGHRRALTEGVPGIALDGAGGVGALRQPTQFVVGEAGGLIGAG